MQFYAPEAFVYLWGIPALLFTYYYSRKLWRRRIARFAFPATVFTKLLPDYRPAEYKLKALCIILAVLFAILALARPQWGEEKRKVERKGVDIIFLLDTSLSMLAEDIKPNRFEKARLSIKSMMRMLKGDRVGMISFAGSSFLQSPLTLDYAAFQLFVDSIRVGYIPDPGTSLNRAIRLAGRSFPKDNTKHRVAILLTDGEDHEGGLEVALEEAKKASMRIYTLGVGTLEGEPIPLRDEDGRKNGFKKDKSGQVVVTRLNQELLEKIASETGALYLPSTPGEEELEILLKHRESLGQKQFKEKLITEKEDHYQMFLLLSILMLLLEWLIRRKKNPKPRAPALPVILIAGLLLGGFPAAQTAHADKASVLYEEKKYQSALDAYTKAKVKNPDDPLLQYNLGTTLYQTENYQQSSQELEKSLKKIEDPKLKSRAYYNYANSQYRLGRFEKAIDAYQKSLELNPDDQDAKYNLEFLQNKKSAFEKKDQQRQNNKNQDQKNNQNKDQKNQQKDQQKNKDQKNDQSNQSGQQKQDSQNQQQNQNQSDQEQQPKDNQQQDQENPKDQEQKKDQKQDGEEKEDPEKGQEKQDQDTRPKEDGEEEKEEPKPEEEGEQEEPKPEEGDQDQEQQPPPDLGGDQPMPAEEQEGQQEKDQPRPGGRPIQGQMTMENALQVLEAMKESEKELQDLRRPTTKQDTPPPAKDW